MTPFRRAWKDRCLATAAAVAVMALAWAPGALAAPARGVSGSVVNGTTGKPVPDLAVTLQLFSDTAELGSMKTTTDAEGAFSFADIATDAKSFQVTAVYKDVLYRNQMSAFTGGKPIEVTLNVYETTSDPTNVAQSWIVWVDQGNTQNCPAGACVQHDIQWNNRGNTAYTGSPSTSGETLIVTQIPLVAGATNFQFLGTFLDTPGAVQGSTYVNPQPIVPGTSGATLRYDVKEISRLTLPIALPTANLQLYVPTGVEVKADGLTAAGEFTDTKVGITYQKFTASNLQAGDEIDVSLSGLSGNKGSSPILLGVLGGLIVVVAGGLALWKIAGRTQRAGPGSSARKAAARRSTPGKRQQAPAKSNGRPGRTPVRLSTRRPAAQEDADEADEDFEEDEAETEGRFDLLIDEIAALDLAYEQGLLREQTYQALRADAKQRLLHLRTGKTGERSST